MDNPIKAFIVRGDFTEGEFAQVTALFRAMDAQRPDAHFELVAVDPTRSYLEGETLRMLRDVLPEDPTRETAFAVAPNPEPGAA